MYDAASVVGLALLGGKCLGAMLSEGENQIFALDVRGDGSSFATAGMDGTVRVYDETTHKEKAKLGGTGVGAGGAGAGGGGGNVGGGHTSRVFGLKYALDDSDVMVSGGWDNTLQVWDGRYGGGSVGRCNLRTVLKALVFNRINNYELLSM